MRLWVSGGQTGEMSGHSGGDLVVDRLVGWGVRRADR